MRESGRSGIRGNLRRRSGGGERGRRCVEGGGEGGTRCAREMRKGYGRIGSCERAHVLGRCVGALRHVGGRGRSGGEGDADNEFCIPIRGSRTGFIGGVCAHRKSHDRKRAGREMSHTVNTHLVLELHPAGQRTQSRVVLFHMFCKKSIQTLYPLGLCIL